VKYSDSLEQSGEYLRQAVRLMSKQAAAPHPVSYAIWYEYVSGRNAALNAAIDEATRNGAVLDEKSTHELFQRHVAGIDEHLAQRVSKAFQKVMADISQSASQAGDHADQFGSALEKFSAELGDTVPGAGVGGGVDALLRQSRAMQGAIASLKVRLDESHQQIEGLRQEVNKAREDALTDGLTGLANRKGFDQALANCLLDESALLPPSLLMADIDFFKRINDTYGHLFGDKVIRAVAQILRDNVKGRDLAARFGGEEFVVLLPETPMEGARELAEKIRAIIDRVQIKRVDKNEAVANITVSLGVASYRPGETAGDFIARADRALYASKSQGRNRVSIAAL
jgi:diguanylate cyclase